MKKNFIRLGFSLSIFFGVICSAVPTPKVFKKFASPVKQADFPIVFHPNYDVDFGWLNPIVRVFHSFDGCKYSRVMKLIDPCITNKAKHVPDEVTEAQLRLVHSPEYLQTLHDSKQVAQILEVPNVVDLRSRVLKPMRYATGGTILAAQLALKQGKAINLSGGYHHAKPNKGEGFCVYADIPIAIRSLWKENPSLKVMVIDLDAHQGNGVAESLKHELQKADSRVALFDMYNAQRYPGPYDGTRAYIRYNNPLSNGTDDQLYLDRLKTQLPLALDEFKPNLIIYNAGTDILDGDKLGELSVSATGIVDRDQFVFEQARSKKTPIAMVLSGGYTRQSADIIAKSIINLTMLN